MKKGGADPISSKLIDRTGHIYGRLTVIGRAANKNGRPVWRCHCACGKIHDVAATSLASGNTKSCGCISVERPPRLRHGLARNGQVSKTYMVWGSMHARCSNPKDKSYERYGGRGIRVCERWQVFDNFLADMGEKIDGTSLDRIDNNGPYAPENCRWASLKTNGRNKRNNRIMRLGDELKTLSAWADESQITQQHLRSRLRDGWPLELAVTTPKGVTLKAARRSVPDEPHS